jgi:hypothetical protein
MTMRRRTNGQAYFLGSTHAHFVSRKILHPREVVG